MVTKKGCNMANLYVLVVEDDATWQDLYLDMLKDAGFRPVIVSTLAEAEAALTQYQYVLAVIDISLSFADYANRGGVKVLKQILQLPSRLPAIVVTGHATIDLAIETLAELNAVHFFRKDNFNRREFMAVAKREALTADLLQILSSREREVLQLMSQGKSNQKIADEIIVSINTVKKHVQSIFTKFNVSTRAAAVAKAMGDK